MNCSSLTRINIPSSVTSIGEAVFNLRCTSFNTLTIPSRVISIETSAFAGCNHLKINCANENQKKMLVQSGVNKDKITVISAQSRDATLLFNDRGRESQRLRRCDRVICSVQ